MRRAVRDLDEEVAPVARVALAHAVLLEVLVEPLDAPRLRQAPVGVEEAVDLAACGPRAASRATPAAL